MNATVRFLADHTQATGSQTGGVFVPTSALHDHNGKKVVWIAFNSRVVEREVKVLTQSSSGFTVKGLTGGENVVTAAPSTLKDGDKIKIKG